MVGLAFDWNGTGERLAWSAQFSEPSDELCRPSDELLSAQMNFSSAQLNFQVLR